MRGASRFALALGIPRVVIGLSLVAFGTSAPEMAVSILSSYRGQADIAVGNVVGSNIVNVLLILGLSAVVVPLSVSKRVVRMEVPLMISTALLFFLVGHDGRLSQGDGLILVGILLGYLLWMVRTAREDLTLEQDLSTRADEDPSRRWEKARLVVLMTGGLVSLVVGSNWLITGAVELARLMGVSELIIGLTIVAAGTSLPELATSVIASVRGERDIAVGNAIGSNIFNILSVLGVSAIVSPNGLDVAPAVIRFDAPVMIAVSLACFPIFFNDFQIKRWEGALFVSYYIFYVVYLLLHASGHDALDEYTLVMRWFVLPFAALTLATTLMFAWHKQVWLPKRTDRKAL